jgi:transposase-like protein
VAVDFDLTETAVREWVKQADIDDGRRSDGITTAEREELNRLRRENRRLAEDVEILKRADSGGFRTPVLADSVQRFWGFSYTPSGGRVGVRV